MCKVFAMTNMSKVKITKKFLNAVKAEVCRTGDKHGFGYAVLSENGELAGERTMRPLEFQPLQINPLNTRTGSLPIVLRTRDQFGELDFAAPKSFIGHGRYSTNDVALENTHPFTNDNIALIHNGVVHDTDGVIEKEALKTTNDTEIILRCWERGGMKLVEETISGYYALAILDKDSGFLHIVRDDTAMLYIAYSRTVDSYIFATTPEIIKSVAKKMQWQIEQPEEMLENMHVVFDRNEILSQTDVTPKYEPRTMTAKERAAFGDGESRSYSGYSNYEGFGVYDASSAVPAGKSPAALEEEDDEPSYRETAQARLKEREAFTTEIESGEANREYINDGAPNASFGYKEESESYDSGYDSGYVDILGRKIG